MICVLVVFLFWDLGQNCHSHTGECHPNLEWVQVMIQPWSIIIYILVDIHKPGRSWLQCTGGTYRINSHTFNLLYWSTCNITEPISLHIGLIHIHLTLLYCLIYNICESIYLKLMNLLAHIKCGPIEFPPIFDVLNHFIQINIPPDYLRFALRGPTGVLWVCKYVVLHTLSLVVFKFAFLKIPFQHSLYLHQGVPWHDMGHIGIYLVFHGVKYVIKN